MNRYRRSQSRRLILKAAGLMLVAALAACGRKNPPKLPEGQTDEFRRQYPTSTDPQQGVFN